METLLERIMKKNCKRQIKQKTVEKVIKIKVDKLYVKWKVYDNLFNSWINKKTYHKCVSIVLNGMNFLV